MGSETMRDKIESNRPHKLVDLFVRGRYSSDEWLLGDNANFSSLQAQTQDVPRKRERGFCDMDSVKILRRRGKPATAPSPSVSARQSGFQDVVAV